MIAHYFSTKNIHVDLLFFSIKMEINAHLNNLWNLPSIPNTWSAFTMPVTTFIPQGTNV